MSYWRVATILMSVQTVVIGVLAVALVITGATGDSSGGVRAVTEGITVLLLTTCSGLVAFGFWRERSVARTPSLVWNALTAIVGFSMVTAGALAAGAAVAVIAVVTFAVTLVLPCYELDNDDTP